MARGALGPARWRRRSGLLRRESDVLEEGEEPFEVGLAGLYVCVCAPFWWRAGVGCWPALGAPPYRHASAHRTCLLLCALPVPLPRPVLLQALPNGHISPALFVALRVLCAPDEEAAGWSGIADALRLPAAAAGRAGGGGQEQPQPELGAVQVWQVLDGDGRPLAATTGTAAAAVAAAAAAPAAAEDAGEQPVRGAAQQYAALLNRDMCELLQGAVRRRQDEYASSLEQELQHLEAALQQATPATAVAEGEEQQVAQRAALLLRVTEQEVLRDLLTALERRLAALPEGEQAAAAEQAAGGQAAGDGAADTQQQQQQEERRTPAGKRKAGGTAAAGSEHQAGQPSRRGARRQRGR